jgi:hypothetical protein
MWAELMEVPNRYVAETWRELFHAEGIAIRLIVPPEHAQAGDFAPRKILVPDSKTHVAREIMRKI